MQAANVSTVLLQAAHLHSLTFGTHFFMVRMAARATCYIFEK